MQLYIHIHIHIYIYIYIYLLKEGLVDAVVSEDSDCIPWGCKEMLFKLKNDGSCESVKLVDVYTTLLPGLDLREFTPGINVQACVYIYMYVYICINFLCLFIYIYV
jgi:hypothetical protein